MKRTSKAFGYCLLSGFVLLIYTVLWWISENVEYKYLGNNFNMVSYAGMLLLIGAFTALLLLIYFRGIGKTSDSGPVSEKGKRWDTILAVGIAAAGIAFFYLIYVHENSIYPAGSGGGHLRSQISRPVYALCACALFAMFVLLGDHVRELSSRKRLPIILLAALLCAAKTYAPNPFLTGMHEGVHMHAYTNSIVNIASLRPLSWNNLSVYGHYGLLYLPLVKLLGNNYTAVALSIAVFAFISYYCVFSVCNDWIKNNSVFLLTILAIFAVPFMIYGGEYFQVNPQRLLVPAVTLYMISKIILKRLRGFRMWLPEIAVGILGLIWNMETGVFSIAVLCAFNLFMALRKKPGVKPAVLLLLKDAAFALCSILGAYLILNLYSFLTGATQWLSLQRTIYPLDSMTGQGGTYKITDLRTGFVTPFSIYVLQLVIFSVVLLNAGYALFFKGGTEEYRNSRAMLLGISLSGLSSVIYFVNRAAYANISISWLQMALVLGIYAGEGMAELRRIRMKAETRPFLSRTAGKLVTLLYVFVLALEGGMRFEPYMKSQAANYWDMKAFDELAEECETKLPEELLAMGQGVPELFFQMHRDDFPVMIDWSDMDGRNYQRAKELADEYISQKKPILVSEVHDLDEYILEKGYRTTWEHPTGNVTFRLLEPVSAEE